MPPFLILSLLASCAPALPVAPTFPSDDPLFSQAVSSPRTGLEDVSALPPDSLSPGDVVSVRFLGSPEMDVAQAIIDRSGRVHLPLVGDILVSGRTLSEAEAMVQEALRRYDRDPHVVMTLVDPKGRFATVVGAVERPGNVPLVGDARLADVLAATGGVRSAGQGERMGTPGDVDGASIVRQGNPLPVDFRLALTGHSRHNIRVRPGDVLYVPPALSGRVVILGHVNRARAIPYHSELRLTEALAEAEGLSRTADDDDVRVIRGGYASPRIYVVSAKDLFAGVRRDVVLAPGDIVYVSEHWFASVGQVLDRVIPLAAAYLLYRGISR